MPLLELRKKSIPLQAVKLSTLAAGNKGKMIDATVINPVEDLYFFNPIDLFHCFLSSPDLCSKMFIGLGQFVDTPSELWQSNAWLSSIRTTSGQFARYSEAESPQCLLIFPSDFVWYLCTSMGCGCERPGLNCEGPALRHLGRVLAVGKDQREQRQHGGELGTVAIKIQRLVPASAMVEALAPGEYIILENTIEYVLQTSLAPCTLKIQLNYAYQSSVMPQNNVIQDATFVCQIYNNQTGI